MKVGDQVRIRHTFGSGSKTIQSLTGAIGEVKLLFGDKAYVLVQEHEWNGSSAVAPVLKQSELEVVKGV